MARIALLGIIFIILSFMVYADPTISSVSGTVEHGQTITISGTDFGYKSPAVPLWWDDGEGAPDDYMPPRTGDYAWVTSSWPVDWKHYTYVTPFSISQDGGEANMKYRTAPYRNVEAPHRYSTKFLAGGHDDERECMGGEPGQAVGVTVGDSERHNTWYVRYYRTLDPLWPTENGGGAMKYGVWETGDNGAGGRPMMYTSQSYLSYAGSGATCNQGQRMNPLGGDTWYGGYAALHLLTSSCGVGSTRTCWDESNTFNPAPSYRNGNWQYNEHLLDYAGNFEQIKQTNVIHIDTSLDSDCVLGNPSIPAPGPRGYSLEGFWKLQMCENSQDDLDDDAWRYMDDIYVDTTFSRVMLCGTDDGSNPTGSYPYDANMVCEPQIPSAWSGSSISANVNLGKITSDTAYLFVFDADNNHNAVGYEVHLGVQEDNVLFECNWEHSTGTGADAISNGGLYGDVDADPNAFEVFSGGPGGRNYLRIYDPPRGAFWIDDPPSIGNPSELYIRYWIRDPTGGERFNYHLIVLSPTTTTFVGASDGFWLERFAGDDTPNSMSICPCIYGGGNSGASYAWSDGDIWGPWHPLTKDQWYLIEFHIINNPGINDYLYVRVDGTDITDSLKYGSSVLGDDNGNLAFPDLNYFRLCTYDKTTGYLTPAYDVAGIKITTGPDWIGGDEPPNLLCGNNNCDASECNTCSGDCSFTDCCDDGSCNNNENCTTCPEDCGNCSVECIHDADQEPCDRVISIGELIAYIELWTAGDVSLQNVMGAIVEWKG